MGIICWMKIPVLCLTWTAPRLICRAKTDRSPSGLARYLPVTILGSRECQVRHAWSPGLFQSGRFSSHTLGVHWLLYGLDLLPIC